MKYTYLFFLAVVTALMISCNAQQGDATQKSETTSVEETEAKSASSPADLAIQRINGMVTLSEEQEDQVRVLGENYDFSATDPAAKRQKRKEFTEMIVEQILTDEQKQQVNQSRKKQNGEND